MALACKQRGTINQKLVFFFPPTKIKTGYTHKSHNVSILELWGARREYEDNKRKLQEWMEAEMNTEK
jgi:hypothetical protein